MNIQDGCGFDKYECGVSEGAIDNDLKGWKTVKYSKHGKTHNIACKTAVAPTHGLQRLVKKI